MGDVSEYRDVLNPLLTAQRLAVLATSLEGQPYGSLVAFAVTDDLRQMLFVTRKGTYKYHTMLLNNRVAMLVDSRRNETSDFAVAHALTAIGTVRDTNGDERDLMAKVYLARHPYLADFLSMSDSSLMAVAVTEYIVAGFDSVRRIHVSAQSRS